MLRRLLARGETIRLLTRAQLAAGHRDKLLGNVWSLLDPLASLAVYYLVFGIGFRQAGASPKTFVLHLFLGIVVWRFVAESIAQATTALRSQRGLVLAADFPKAVIPIAICCARLYDLLWALVVVGLAAGSMGTRLSLEILWLPALLGLAFAFTLGVCFVVARIGLFFADTVNVVGAGLRLWVLVSPIFYFARSEHGHAGIVPPGLLDYYMLNPIAGLLGAVRDVLIWRSAPRADDLGTVLAWSVGALVLGFVFFARAEGRYAKSV
ncbi:MAG: ABC transporter permease [Deltaproteobacteria bacterium]|nr:ABC transporter permease [Deltaproteobacteria bacterium]